MRMSRCSGPHGKRSWLTGCVVPTLPPGWSLMWQSPQDLSRLSVTVRSSCLGWSSTLLLLPDCGNVSDLGLRVVSGDRRSLGGRLSGKVPFFSHEQCILSPHLLDFSSWISDSPICVTGLCLSHLVTSLQAPPLIKHFKALAPRLGRLRLMADLVRGALHLWAHGRPAFLLTTPVECPGLSAVRRAAPFAERFGEAEILSNFQDVASLVSRFTL